MKQRAYTLLELILALAVVSLALYLCLPRGKSSKDRLSSQMAAEELVTQLRRARQTAISKKVRVGLAIPSSASAAYSDKLCLLEGDVNPRVSESLKIEQDAYRTVYFVGQWSGPAWTTLPQTMAPLSWWNANGTPLPAHLFIFSPRGTCDASGLGADGAYRILVAQGLAETGGTLTRAESPWTVSITPAGDVDLQRGLWKSDRDYASNVHDTPVGAVYRANAGGNRSPRLVSLRALPDVRNPNGSGNLIGSTSCLTLELRVQDDDGDPPFFRWEASRVLDANGAGRDAGRFGGRFAHGEDCRMEWSEETHEWVGRVSWTPALDDQGGCSYQLQCEVDDRQGGVLRTGFPVQGYLKTTKEEWILYKTIGKNQRWELWKMTKEGREHQRVAGFANEDVRFGQWTPAGDEAVLATAGAVYRAKADGSGQRLVSRPGKTPIDGCCLSPDAASLFYVTGGQDDKQLRRVTLGGGGEEDTAVADEEIDELYNLSAAYCSGRLVVVQNFYRHWKTLIGLKTKRRSGIVVYDVETRTVSGTKDVPPSLYGRGQDRSKTGGVAISEDGREVLWGWGGSICIAPVGSPGPPADGFQLGPERSIATGLADVHHPRYTWDKKGLVFANGRGAGARVWCLPDLNNPGSLYQVPLAADNLCADEPSVSRPR